MSKFPRHLTIAANKFDFFSWSDSTGIANCHEGRFLNLLSEILRFEYTLVTPLDKQWGSVSEDGNWTGMIGMISRGEADLAIGHISVTNERRLGADFTEPYTDNKLSYAADLPSPKPKSLTYLYPFQTTTWICMAAVLLLMPFLLGTFYRTKFSYTKLLFVVVGTVLRQDFCRNKVRKSAWVGGWWLVASLFSICYAAVISSFLTVPLHEAVLKEYGELAKAVARGKYEVYYRKGTASRQHLFESGQEHLVSIAEAIDKNNWVLDKFIDPTKKFGQCVFLAPRMRLYFQYGKPPFAIKFVSEDDSVYRDVAIAVRKDFCCKRVLDRVIFRIKAAGLFDKLINDELYYRSIRAQNTSGDSMFNKLSLHDISGALFVLACGYGLSVVCFLFELCSAHMVKGS